MFARIVITLLFVALTCAAAGIGYYYGGYSATTVKPKTPDVVEDTLEALEKRLEQAERLRSAAYARVSALKTRVTASTPVVQQPVVQPAVHQAAPVTQPVAVIIDYRAKPLPNGVNYPGKADTSVFE